MMQQCIHICRVIFAAFACAVITFFLPSAWADHEPDHVEPEQGREKQSYIQELEKVPTLAEEKKEKKLPKKKWVFFPAAVGTSFTYFEDSDDDRIRQITATTQLLNEKTFSFLYGSDLAKFEDRGFPNIYLATQWMEAKKSFSENLSTSLFYGFKDYHNGGKDENVYATSVNHIFKDKLLTNLNFAHFDVIQNNAVILKNVEVNQWSSLFDFIATKNLSLQNGYIGAHYTDGNDSQGFYTQATYVWFDVPIIKTSYQYSITEYDFSSPFYFSFDGFQNHLVSFSWEHNLSQNLGYAFRQWFASDNMMPGDWSSQLSTEIYYSPWNFFSVLAQYAYYDSEVFRGRSFTSNTVFLSAVLSF